MNRTNFFAVDRVCWTPMKIMAKMFNVAKIIYQRIFIYHAMIFLSFSFTINISHFPEVMKIVMVGKRRGRKREGVEAFSRERFIGWMIHFLSTDICDNFQVLPTNKMSNGMTLAIQCESKSPNLCQMAQS